jgi:hypothetical protein
MGTSYIQHLQAKVKMYGKYEAKFEIEKQNASKNTTNFSDELDLWYTKGLYNGSIELITFAIDSIINDLEKSKSCISLEIEMLIEKLRKFHEIYFGANKLNETDTKFVKKSCWKRKLPNINSKIMKRVRLALSSSECQLSPRFYRKFLKKAKSTGSMSRYSSNSSDSESEQNQALDYVEQTSQQQHQLKNNSNKLTSSQCMMSCHFHQCSSYMPSATSAGTICNCDMAAAKTGKYEQMCVKIF